MFAENTLKTYTPIDISTSKWDKFYSLFKQQNLDLYRRNIEIPKTSVKIDLKNLNESLLSRDDIIRCHIDLTVTYNCLFIKNNTSNELLVILSGARNEGESGTLFKRWSYYSFCKKNILLIADPVLERYQHEGLRIGWYCNIDGINHLKNIAMIVKQFQKAQKILDNNVCFFGSSGGGYAALSISEYFNQALFVAINPQIFIDKHSLYNELLKITQLDSEQIEKKNIPKLIKDNINNTYCIIQNLNAKNDCEKHLFPLLRLLDIRSVSFGANNFKNLIVLAYEAEGGHNAQGDQIFFSKMMNVAEDFARSNHEISYDRNIDTILFLSLFMKASSKKSVVTKS